MGKKVFCVARSKNTLRSPNFWARFAAKIRSARFISRGWAEDLIASGSGHPPCRPFQIFFHRIAVAQNIAIFLFLRLWFLVIIIIMRHLCPNPNGLEFSPFHNQRGARILAAKRAQTLKQVPPFSGRKDRWERRPLPGFEIVRLEA